MWGIKVKGGDWVVESDGRPVLHDTRRAALADLKDFTMKFNRDNYEVQNYDKKTTPDVKRLPTVRPRTKGDGLAPLVSVRPE